MLDRLYRNSSTKLRVFQNGHCGVLPCYNIPSFIYVGTDVYWA